VTSCRESGRSGFVSTLDDRHGTRSSIPICYGHGRILYTSTMLLGPSKGPADAHGLASTTEDISSSLSSSCSALQC
jgi:hypothetical protein